MSGYITDRLEDARQYAVAYMRSRSEAGVLMQDVVWSRQGLCYAVFDMLDILPPEGMRELFEDGDHANLDLDAIEARAHARDDVPALVARVRKLERDCATLAQACHKYNKAPAGSQFRFQRGIAGEVARIQALESTTAHLAAVNQGLKQRVHDLKVASLNSAVELRQSAGVECGTSHEDTLAKVRELDDDNAALRLAATQLYEFVTIDCGVESYGMDAIYRMANVLGIKTQGEGAE